MEDEWRMDRSCNGTAKENKMNLSEKSTVDIFTIFCLTFVLVIFRWRGTRFGDY